LPPLPAPNARSPNQKDDSGSNQLAFMVDLDKLLKGPIEEIYRNNAPGDAEFLVAHMKASLQGLQPTIESFEEYNLKLEDENSRLSEEEADLDERLRSLGIVVAPGGNNGSAGKGGGVSSSSSGGGAQPGRALEMASTQPEEDVEGVMRMMRCVWSSKCVFFLFLFGGEGGLLFEFDALYFEVGRRFKPSPLFSVLYSLP